VLARVLLSRSRGLSDQDNSPTYELQRQEDRLKLPVPRGCAETWPAAALRTAFSRLEYAPSSRVGAAAAW
jgi:hypothetical protein